MAGHKGYAIAMMVDVLSGSGFLSQVHSPYKTAEKSNCGHFMIAINIEAFQPLAQFNTRMEQYIAELKSVPLAKGHDEVFILAKSRPTIMSPIGATASRCLRIH